MCTNRGIAIIKFTQKLPFNTDDLSYRCHMIVNQINTDLLANAKEFKTTEELEYILQRHFQLHRDEHRHEFANTQYIMGKKPTL